MPTKAFAAQSATSPLAPFSIDRREPDANESAQEFGVINGEYHFLESHGG